MNDAVRQPSQDVEDWMLVGGQDVGQVGAIQDIFEGRENANPDVRTILVVDEAASRISDSPVNRRRNWVER